MSELGYKDHNGEDVGNLTLRNGNNLSEFSENPELARDGLAIGSMAVEDNVAGLTFPTTDGVPGQALVTDGAGTLSYQDVEGVDTHGAEFVTKPSISGETSDLIFDGRQYEYIVNGSTALDPEATGITYHWSITSGVLSSNVGELVTISFDFSHMGTTQKLTVYAVDDLGNTSISSELFIQISSVLAPVITSFLVPTEFNINEITPISAAIDNGGGLSFTTNWEISNNGGSTWSTLGIDDPTSLETTVTVDGLGTEFTQPDENEQGLSYILKLTVVNVSGTVEQMSNNIFSVDQKEDTDSLFVDNSLHTLYSSEIYMCAPADGVNRTEITSFAPNEYLLNVGDTILANGILAAVLTVENIDEYKNIITTTLNEPITNIRNLADEYEVQTLIQDEGQAAWGKVFVDVILKGVKHTIIAPKFGNKVTLSGVTISPFKAEDKIIIFGTIPVIATITSITEVKEIDGTYTTVYFLDKNLKEDHTEMMGLLGRIKANIGDGELNLLDVVYSYESDTSYRMTAFYREITEIDGLTVNINISSDMCEYQNIDILRVESKLYSNSQHPLTMPKFDEIGDIIANTPITLSASVDNGTDGSDTLGYVWWTQVEGQEKGIDYLSDPNAKNPILNVTAEGESLKIGVTIYNFVNSVSIESEFFTFESGDNAFAFGIDGDIRPTLLGTSDVFDGDAFSIHDTGDNQNNLTKYYDTTLTEIAFKKV